MDVNELLTFLFLQSKIAAYSFHPFRRKKHFMLFRNCFATSLLFCILVAIAAAPFATAQGTPGGKTTIITEFTPLSQEELKKGTIRLFDGFSTYGWKDDVNVKVENGRLLTHYSLDALKNTPIWGAEGLAGELCTIPGGSSADLRTMVLQQVTMLPHNMTPLFDGKTLDGWSIRGKAEAVVVDGVIKLTNGSGSLASDGKYGDFILQLEYFTPVRPEGKGVNSGVFFRCIPEDMMNGYECQILNNAGAGDYERFIGTDTGGIFRRQVGRNVGPKDGEWNYLTLAAKGNRIATWVNGIQTADWTDERAPHANPRNGCRVEAGTIQFQGHDPETEILFRNIRIREL